MASVVLRDVDESEKQLFISQVQAAFQAGFENEFGETSEVILPVRDVEESFAREGARAYFACLNNTVVGGCVVVVDSGKARGSLDLLYVNGGVQSRGVGQQVWALIEKIYPEVKTWETHTPYFDKRNIHFYVNRLGFHIVEFFNKNHPDPHLDNGSAGGMPSEIGQNFFRFEKRIH